jgi:hypothetical protein
MKESSKSDISYYAVGFHKAAASFLLYLSSERSLSPGSRNSRQPEVIGKQQLVTVLTGWQLNSCITSKPIGV